MSRKFALVIGNTEYTDPGLVRLTAPANDADDFARVLRDPGICAFDDVKVMLNEPSQSVVEAIDEFFDQRKPDDLLMLYFSGHGLRDEVGALYLAFRNTIRTRLRATALRSDYIRDAMDESRSKRQVVVLDCCNSGAFPQGTKAQLGGPMGMLNALQGYGRFVLMASDATQFAWEGDRLIGEAKDSLFTHFLVKGLEGEADVDGDGAITVDELYDYAFQQISRITQKQTPTKAASKVEGDIVLRHMMSVEDIKPVPLPRELLDEAEDLRPYVREAAVQKLDKILRGKNLALARSAAAALEKVVTDENTTRRVAQEAEKALAWFRQREQQIAGTSTLRGSAPDPAAAIETALQEVLSPVADVPAEPSLQPADIASMAPKGPEPVQGAAGRAIENPTIIMRAPSIAAPVTEGGAGAAALPFPAEPPRGKPDDGHSSSEPRRRKSLVLAGVIAALLAVCACAAIVLPRISPAVRGLFAVPVTGATATDTSTATASAVPASFASATASRLPATTASATDIDGRPKALVKSNNVKAREGPDLRFPPILDLPQGTTCDLLGHWFNWYVLDCNGKSGWVYADWLTIPEGVQLPTIDPISTPQISRACRKYCK